MEVNLDGITVCRRILILSYDIMGSIIGIDSTDTIYNSFDEAYKDLCSIICDAFGGITDETIDDRYKIVVFKQEHQNEIDDAYTMTFEVLHRKYNTPIIRYFILPIVAKVNKPHIMAYRGMIIESFDFGKLAIYDENYQLIAIKKSLDLALSFIDTYLLIKYDLQ